MNTSSRRECAELWIVDLQRRVLHAHRKPNGDAYGEMTTHQPGDQIGLTLAPEIVVKLDLVFG